MKKAAFLFTIISLFCSSIRAQVFIGLNMPSDCAPATVDLINNSDVGVNNPVWEWNINGVVYSDFDLIGKVYDAGFYNVTLTLYDSSVFFGSDFINFQIYADASSFMVSPAAEACPGEQLQFNFDDNISWYSVNWDFGDNSVPEPQYQSNWPTHTFYKAGTYDVTLTLEHYCGPDTIVQQVIVGPTAKPGIQAYISNGPDFCPSDPVVFDVQGDYPSYHWQFGDGTESFKRKASHVYPNDGPATYEAVVTATNACGNSNSDTVTVSFTDAIPAEAGFDRYFYGETQFPCPGTPVEFNSWGAGVFEWDFGDGSFSNEQNPVNYYTQPGQYNVTLKVYNGCGQSAMYSDSVTVMFDASDQPYTDFYAQINDFGSDQYWDDTITICPGMIIEFKNETYSYSGADMSFEWDFGDGTSAFSKNAGHKYTIASATPYTVKLSATNTCGGSSSRTKYVMVDAGLKPEVEPMAVPLVICNGEQVYFYLNEGSQYNYTYNFNFGDGQSASNLKGYSDSIIQVITSHTYSGGPGSTFDFLFSTVNVCGNSTDFAGTVTITDDPLHKPFYYVENTTNPNDGENPQTTDWSVRTSPADVEMTIHATWPDWPGGQDNFAVYLWYGGFDPGTGPPNGMVQFRTANIATKDSVKVYIPINPLYPPSVGFAVGWTCSGIYDPNVEPEVYNLQFDDLGLPQSSFDISPGLFLNMKDTGPAVILDQGNWDGICNSERPFNQSYYQLNEGQFIQLYLDEDLQEYYLDATRDKQGNDYITNLSWGSYFLNSPTSITFVGNGDCGDLNGDYDILINGDQMTFTWTYDDCQVRKQYLTSGVFLRKKNSGNSEYDLAACPGDDVLFKVAGGKTYLWNFGDGSATSTARYPKHKYAVPGNYDAFVVATNACGRVDTIHSEVRISADNLPYVYYWWEGGEVTRLEDVMFRTEFYIDQVGNYSYMWDFGDGTTSTNPNPVHRYQKSGDYQIRLTVSNSCGSSTETQYIYVKDAPQVCEAKFAIDSITGTTAYFKDISRGEVSSWFWDFGDGFTSAKQNPVHAYDRNGSYWVCLAIFDSINNCSQQVCRQVEIGTQLCRADFTQKVNISSNRVQFFDESVNATEWFWDFGDGTFSDIKDPVHTYNYPGWYTVCLSIYNNSNDCFSFKCSEIQVGQEDADICFSQFSYFVDETTNTVKFTDKSSENITNWYWTFGDGTFIEDRNPVKVYKNPGIYQVCLIVFNSETGCTDETCMKIPVGVADCNLRGDFAFFVDITNNSVNFSDNTSGKVTNYFWDFGDGVTSSKMNPAHNYEAPGFYLVTLSVRNSETGCNDHVGKLIQIGTVDCRAGFDYTIDPVNRTVKFINTSQGTEYFWDFDDGTYSDVKNPVHTYRKPGMYFVSLTVVNDLGLCMDFIFEPIQVGTVDCAARFHYFIDSATNVAYFTPEAIGSATNYLWYFGDGAISTQREARHFFAKPGYFTVGLNTYDNVSGCMDYWEQVILIGSAGQDCRAGFNYISDVNTRTVKFGDRSKGQIVDYIWDFGDGNTSKLKNPENQYALGGYYLTCLTVVNSFGIPNTYCNYVQVATSDAERCFADFVFSVDSIGRTAEFFQTSHGDPDVFMWHFGDGDSTNDENPDHVYQEPGYYMVELEVTNSTSTCTSRNFALLNVGMGNLGLRADFAYKLREEVKKADTYPVDFVGVSLGDAGKLKWDFGDGSTDTTTLNPTHYYSQPGIYNACLTVSNPNTGDETVTCQTVTIGNTGTGEDPYALAGQVLRNYPNPFDRVTWIEYDLRNTGRVDLALFDQTGRMVDILVREVQSAGSYRMEYDGSGLDSGIYTLRMVTDEGIYTARMIK